MTVLVSGLGALGLVVFLSGLPPFRSVRLAQRIEPYLSGLHGRPSALLSRASSGESRGARLVRRLERAVPLSQRGLEERLAEAGDERNGAQFRLNQLVWAIGSIIVVWLVVATALLTGAAIDALALPPLTVISAAAGFLGCDWRLSKRIQQRRHRLQEELPSAVDLMTLSILAGESVAAALARVGGQISSGIGEELRLVVANVRAGASVIDALEAFKNRVPVAGVARLVDALINGIERGAPLADVLRAQAEDGREARRRFLLELAGRREVLMLVPVVFLIMPVVVVYTLFPGLVALELLVP